MIVNGNKLAELYGVDRRTVTNWVNERPPCPSRKEGTARAFDTAEVARWHAARAARAAVAEVQRAAPPVALDQSRAKREAMLARLAELEDGCLKWCCFVREADRAAAVRLALEALRAQLPRVLPPDQDWYVERARPVDPLP